MTLNDIVKMLDDLSATELNELREQIDQLQTARHPARGLTPEERIQRLEAAATEIRSGFTSEEWAEVERAMNEEYVEPSDDDQWKD